MSLQEMNIAAQLADMKEVDYHNTLLLSTLIELLVEKQIVNREEILSVMRELDKEMLITVDDSTWLQYLGSRHTNDRAANVAADL